MLESIVRNPATPSNPLTNQEIDALAAERVEEAARWYQPHMAPYQECMALAAILRARAGEFSDVEYKAAVDKLLSN